MTILIANIGTSDLAVRPQELDSYLPIGFDRNEKNAGFKEKPTEDEKAIWEEKDSFIISELCPELDVKVTSINGKDTFSFREFTLKLKEAYEKDRKTWHKRISPGRIAGVLKRATSKPFNVTEAHIFVSNQNPPQHGDTIYLFDILKLWCEQEFQSLNLKKEEINFSAVDQDALFQHYYHFFNGITQTEMILVSIKGGTPQMKEALKIQAMASGIASQLFIEPDLCKTKLLRGKPSECNLTSYWQYMRTQNYQTVNLLLKGRWDFDGSVKILQEWKEYLKFVTRYKASPQNILISSIINVNKVITALSVAVDCFNLYVPGAKKTLEVHPKRLKAYPELQNFIDWDTQISQSAESQLLNLYTRCRIYWKLEQAANFLASMSSFYEEVLYRVLEIYNGKEFFEGNDSRKWYLSQASVAGKMGQQKWNELSSDQCNYRNGRFQLKDRPCKRKFLEELVSYRQQQLQDWATMLDALKRLDYWAKKRNDMIHGASGISIERMHELYDQDCNQNPQPCKPDKILEVMAEICQSPLPMLRQNYQKYVGGDDYYIYSQIREWAIAQLMEDAKR